MRVLVTGGDGFVARWLVRELDGNGHEAIARSRGALDVTDHDAVATAIRSERPDAVAHLAAVSFAPEAAEQPGHALAVAVAGTQAVLEGVRSAGRETAVLVAGSSEVYGRPRPEDLPLTEEAPLRAATTYALTKLAQEAQVVAASSRWGLRAVATRSFNHSGRGQRTDFVLPALAARVAAVARGETRLIRAGNVDVRRDFLHVEDVARAYRLLLERLVADGRALPPVVNVCSGSAVPLRTVIETLSRLAGIDMEISVDPSLVRAGDPPEIRGDPSLLRTLTGWSPRRSIDELLAELLAWQQEGGRQ